MTGTGKLTHIDAGGEAHMVDVGGKQETERVAIAEGYIRMAPETLALILAGDAKKGDVIGVAQIAGIMGAKKTSDIIPLCHPLMLTKVSVDISQVPELPGLRVEAMAKLSGRTGVEMEALTAVSVACLTLYDMAKAADKSMEITGIKLLSKTGGKSGNWQRDQGGGAL